jgi:hypothetical protein
MNPSSSASNSLNAIAAASEPMFDHLFEDLKHLHRAEG